MPDRAMGLNQVTGALVRFAGSSVCHMFGRHAPAPALKSNGLFLYGRCRFCTKIVTCTRITETSGISWRAAHSVDEAYFAEMRDIHH